MPLFVLIQHKIIMIFQKRYLPLLPKNNIIMKSFWNTLLICFTFCTGCGFCAGCGSKPNDDNSENKPTPVGIYNNLAATDALGRRLPDNAEAGNVRNNKYIALFYWTWQNDMAKNSPAYDVTKILAQHPDAINDYNHPAWPKNAPCFFWGEPLYGYYRRTDPWVLRRHAELLAMAEVDVIFFDCTNGDFTWEEAYMELCKVFTEARAEGVKTPQIAFMMAFGATDGSRSAVQQVYNKLYKPGIYNDLIFKWDGKPLIMAYPDNLSDELKKYFTFRPGQPTYNTGPVRQDQWGWLEIYPQHGYYQTNRGFEQVTVGVAQNWSAERGLTAMNAPNSFGRSYTNKDMQHHSEPNAVAKGYNFQEQWERALQLDPSVVFITGWNEWIAGRFEMWQQQANAFPDEYSQEGSRDIEPMKNGHGDNYYYQMVANIRRFKGVAPPEPPSEPLSVAIDGIFNEWNNVKPLYETPKGNTLHRNHPGWVGEFFTNTTGRNDFVTARVARDADNIYFYVETADAITPQTDPAWMRLFIDADRNHATGWEGYDFVVNRLAPESNTAIIERSANGWNWQRCGEAQMYVAGDKLELSIPRATLQMTSSLNFEFKWSDNMQSDGDITDFYLNGDQAPIARFNFIFKEK
jgi:hypothetical protein